MAQNHRGNFGDYPDSPTATESVVIATLIHETASAILISVVTEFCDTVDETQDVWIPMSQISRICRDPETKQVKFTAKNWILQKKGLI